MIDDLTDAVGRLAAYRSLPPAERARYRQMAEDDARSDRLQLGAVWSEAQIERRAAQLAHDVPTWGVTADG